MVVIALNDRLSPTNTEVRIKRSLDNGATWSAKIPVSNSDGRSEDPCVAAEGTYIHLSWNDKRSGVMLTYYRRSTDQGSTWGPETALIGTSSGTYSTMVSLDGPNVDVPCGDLRNGNFDVYMRRSAD